MRFPRKRLISTETLELMKKAAIGITIAQATAIVTVHAVDHMGKQRVPGGRHGFPTLERADIQIPRGTV